MECLGRGERFSGFVEAFGWMHSLLKGEKQAKSRRSAPVAGYRVVILARHVAPQVVL
jgi:hypothetical protein